MIKKVLIIIYFFLITALLILIYEKYPTNNLLSSDCIFHQSQNVLDYIYKENNNIKIDWCKLSQFKLNRTEFFPNSTYYMGDSLKRIREVKALINPEGYRGKLYNISNETFKILLLGDSFTFGFGVQDNETFGYHLGKMFGENYQVLNFGVPGYDAEKESDLFFKKGVKYHPNLVIIQYLGNDVENYDIDFKIIYVLKKVYNFSDARTEELTIKTFHPDYQRWLYSKQPLKDLMNQRIFRYYDKLINSNYKLLFIIFPDSKEKEDLLKQYFKEKKQDAIFLKDFGFTYHSKWTLGDGHPSPYAHKRIAKILFNHIKKI